MISTLVPADLPECVTVYTATFNGPPWNESWHESDVVRRLDDLVATPGAVGVCARDVGGTLVGFALGHVERNQGEDHFSLREMCVRSDAQRCGWGGQLLVSLGERLPDVARWYLLTARDSGPSAFYEAHGFHPAHRMGVYVRP